MTARRRVLSGMKLPAGYGVAEHQGSMTLYAPDGEAVAYFAVPYSEVAIEDVAHIHAEERRYDVERIALTVRRERRTHDRKTGDPVVSKVVFSVVKYVDGRKALVYCQSNTLSQDILDLYRVACEVHAADMASRPHTGSQAGPQAERGGEAA